MKIPSKSTSAGELFLDNKTCVHMSTQLRMFVYLFTLLCVCVFMYEHRNSKLYHLNNKHYITCTCHLNSVVLIRESNGHFCVCVCVLFLSQVNSNGANLRILSKTRGIPAVAILMFEHLRFCFRPYDDNKRNNLGLLASRAIPIEACF